MISFLKRIVSNERVESSKKLMGNVKKISKLSEEVNIREDELTYLDYSNLAENKKDMVISLSDCLELLNTTNLSMDTIVSKCRHITELNDTKCSTIEVYSIVEDEHVVLCPDVKTCEKHKGYKGDKIKITTIRR